MQISYVAAAPRCKTVYSGHKKVIITDGSQSFPRLDETLSWQVQKILYVVMKSARDLDLIIRSRKIFILLINNPSGFVYTKISCIQLLHSYETAKT